MQEHAACNDKKKKQTIILFKENVLKHHILKHVDDGQK